MSRAKIICCCSEATPGCEKSCLQGKTIKPKVVFNNPYWDPIKARKGKAKYFLSLRGIVHES